jgi:hypothetical protein
MAYFRTAPAMRLGKLEVQKHFRHNPYSKINWRRNEDCVLRRSGVFTGRTHSL